MDIYEALIQEGCISHKYAINQLRVAYASYELDVERGYISFEQVINKLKNKYPKLFKNKEN